MGFDPRVPGFDLGNWVHLGLLISILVLCGVVVGFVFYALTLRVRNIRKSRRWSDLEARWQPVLDAALAESVAGNGRAALRGSGNGGAPAVGRASGNGGAGAAASGNRGAGAVAGGNGGAAGTSGNGAPPGADGHGDAGATEILVRRGEELYFVDFLYKRARGREAEERAVMGRLAAPYLGPIVRRTRGGDAERRARAVQTLALLGLPEHKERVAAALDDPSPLVAMIAARCLATEEYPEVAPAIMQRLHRFDDWSPKYLSSMLFSMGEKGLPTLRDTLADPRAQSQTRAVAADALRKLRDAEAADIAGRVVETTSDPDVLAACLRLLREVGGPEHLPAIRSLTTAPDFGVRAQAVSALGRLAKQEDIARLRRALDDESSWVVMHASRALRDHGEGALLRDLAVGRHRHTDILLQVLTE